MSFKNTQNLSQMFQCKCGRQQMFLKYTEIQSYFAQNMNLNWEQWPQMVHDTKCNLSFAKLV